MFVIINFYDGLNVAMISFYGNLLDIKGMVEVCSEYYSWGFIYKRLNLKLKWTLFQVSSVDNCFLRKVLFVGWLFCFWLRGQLSTNFVKNWGGTKFTNELAWLRCLKQLKLLNWHFIMVYKMVDVNCLTLGLRLFFLWPFDY